MRYRLKTLIVSGVVAVLVGAVAAQALTTSCNVDDPFCFDRSAHETAHTITKVTMPDIAVPLWLNQPTTQSNGDIQ